MRLAFYILGLLAVSPLLVGSAQAQVIPVINVNASDICFFNYTAGWRVWQQCGADDDFLEWTILPWEWISGGYLSLVLVSIIALFTYIKYHKIAYPILTGMMLLPVSYFMFPEIFLVVAFIMAGIGMAAFVFYAFLKQTKEY